MPDPNNPYLQFMPPPSSGNVWQLPPDKWTQAEKNAGTTRTVVQTTGDQIDNRLKAATQPFTITKAQADAAEAQAKAVAAQRGAALAPSVGEIDTARQKNIDEVLHNIDLAGQLSKGWAATGVPGAVAQYIPGTDAHRLSSMLDSLNTQIALDKTRMGRQDSGGAGGNGMKVTQAEFLKFGNSIAPLSIGDGQEQLNQGLGRVQDYYKTLKVAGQGQDPSNPIVAQRAKIGMFGSLRPNDAATALANAQTKLNQATSTLPPAARQVGLQKFNSNPAIIALRAQAGNAQPANNSGWKVERVGD